MEATILLWIQNHLRSDFLTPVMSGISTLGHGSIWVLLTLILLLGAGITHSRNKKTGSTDNPFLAPALACLLAMVFSLLFCNGLIKPIAARTRPFNAISGLTVLGEIPTDYSFPSGHTSFSFACAAAFFLTVPKKYRWTGVLALIFAALVGFSRLYLGAHYPTDVLVGLVLGCLCGKAAELIIRALQKRKTA